MTDPLRAKAYTFAVSIVRLCLELQNKKEFVLSKQLLKSGTSIAANIEEAIQAQSPKDFVSKFSISLKESVESDFWLRLLTDSSLLTEQRTAPFRKDLSEIIRILVASIKTAKQKIRE